MDPKAIEVLTTSTDVQQLRAVLEEFLKLNESAFSFPDLSLNDERALCWTALFQLLENNKLSQIHPQCLAAIRLLSRDKTELENLLCEKWLTILLIKSGLYGLMGFNDESTISLELPVKDIVLEALKCLCNIVFNSEVARNYCAQADISKGIVARIRIYKEIPYKDDIMLYDMKLLFILTALRPDVKEKVTEQHGMDYLISCLNELLVEASTLMDVAGAASAPLEGGSHEYFLNNNQQAIICQVLKTMFNLIFHSGSEYHSAKVTEEEDAMYLRLMQVITMLLYAHTSSAEQTMELRSDIANLLTSIPPPYYSYLTPPLVEGENAQNSYEGYNMDALQALIQLLQHRLTVTTNTTNQYENLSPILTVMNKSVRSCRVHRRYLRQVVLPPLRDVTRRPEKGTTLRNQMCRLLTTPVTVVRDLCAEFLFLLCKEKVGRLVKYTGFGNAAGHLAQKGLLSGGRSGQYSSSSEGSDTEEYLEAQPNIDPVVGCTMPPRVDPFEGMSEEQKEYEAMKLVNLFDKLVTEGVVRPARIGDDGRPEPLEHVLQIRDSPPNRPRQA